MTAATRVTELCVAAAHGAGLLEQADPCRHRMNRHLSPRTHSSRQPRGHDGSHPSPAPSRDCNAGIAGSSLGHRAPNTSRARSPPRARRRPGRLAAGATPDRAAVRPLPSCAKGASPVRHVVHDQSNRGQQYEPYVLRPALGTAHEGLQNCDRCCRTNGQCSLTRPLAMPAAADRMATVHD